MQTFNGSYSTFIADLQTNAFSNGYELDFTPLCDPSSDFLSNNYGNLDESSRTSTILVYAYNAVSDLFGSDYVEPASQSTPPTWPDWVSTLSTEATQYMNTLMGIGTASHPAAAGINLVSNYYAAGTYVTQAAYAMADLLQKAYTVFAFTLQFAANCPAVQSYYGGEYAGPGDVYNYSYTDLNDPKNDINIPNLLATVNSDNLSTYLGYLNDNFNTQFLIHAKTYFEAIATPFLNGGSYWDPVALVTSAGLNLEPNFMQSGCFPLSYVKKVNTNGNLDYLAAECNYNGNWNVLQLYIPTNNGTEGLTNIRYFSDFGLIGNIDYPQIQGFLKQPSMLSDGTCNSHCKDICGTGFHDCYINSASIALDGGAAPFYGAGTVGPYDGLICDDGSNPQLCATGVNPRYSFGIDNCPNGGYPDDTCTMSQYAFAITPNGHVFAGALKNTWCVNGTIQDMRNNQINFGVFSITEDDATNGSSVSIKVDNTQINARGPAQNPVGENGNENNVAEYGFGMAPQSTPQPDAAPCPVCAIQGPIVLSPVYSYSDGGQSIGTITDVTTISVNGNTGTFDDTYSTLTLNNTIWTRVTSTNSENAGPQTIQALWQTGPTGQQQYMISKCYLTISGNVSGDTSGKAVSITLTISDGDSQTATTDSNGNYMFPVGNGAYTVTPSLSGYSFIPASTPVTVSDADVPNINFTSQQN